VTSFLLKRVLAESATMRLDDEFGSLPFSEEVKALANAINRGQFQSVAEAADADFVTLLRVLDCAPIPRSWGDVVRNAN
jgi:hypothetical protein